MKNKMTPTVTISLDAAHALSHVLARREWSGKIAHGSVLWQAQRELWKGINNALKAFEGKQEKTNVRKKN